MQYHDDITDIDTALASVNRAFSGARRSSCSLDLDAAVNGDANHSEQIDSMISLLAILLRHCVRQASVR